MRPGFHPELQQRTKTAMRFTLISRPTARTASFWQVADTRLPHVFGCEHMTNASGYVIPPEQDGA